MKEISVKINPRLEALAESMERSVENIIETFISDLTNHISNQGSDERDLARQYLMRGALVPIEQRGKVLELLEVFESEPIFLKTTEIRCPKCALAEIEGLEDYECPLCDGEGTIAVDK